jgi:uncharacterized damage-inducible protein DinB
MTHLALLVLPDIKVEAAATRRMLAAFPDDHAGFRPHERSRTLAELATHVARLPLQGVNVLTKPDLDIAGRSAPPALATSAALLAEFDAAFAAFQSAASGITPESLAEPWSLRQGGKILHSAPRAAMLRVLCLSHLVHHRGQLSVYYRLLDLRVPGMYGPSADDVFPS